MKEKIFITIYLIFFFFTASASTIETDTILKRAMSAAEKYNGLVEKYKAEVYTRTFVETVKKNFLYKYTHFIPQFVLHDPGNDEALIETLSTLKFDYPNNYVHDIKYVTGSITKKKDVDLIPFNMLNFNVYGETTNDESFFMPLRFSTAKYYNYKLARTYTENNKTYYTIDFTPIYENQKLLKGSFIIESGTWRVTFFRGVGIDIFSDFSLEITMGNEWVTNYLPEDFVIYQTASYLGNVVASRYLAHIDYTDIVLRSNTLREKSLNISNFYKVRLDSVPVYSDSAFWNNSRPIPLQAREKDVMTDFQHREAERMLERSLRDSTAESRKAAQQFAQRMVMDSRYQYKSTKIGYGGLLNPLLLGYSTYDGLTYRQKLSFHVDLKRNRNIKINAFAGYMFKRKDLVADITTTFNYEPFRLGSATLSIGSGNPTYSSLFVQQIQDSLKNQGLKFEDISPDYFKDYYLRMFNTFEWTNGLLVNTGVEYHIRTRANNPSTRAITANSQEIDDIIGTRRAFVPFLRVTWTPEQYYRYEGRQKIYVRSRFPTFKLELSRSFKGMLGSTSSYNRVEFDINQNIPVGLMHAFHYHVGAGVFTNQKTEYFADFYYFSKNNFPETWDDRLGGSFNLLSRQLYNASDSYIQGHLMYETPFLILKKIPFVSDFAERERIYFSQLYTPQIVSYTELGYGIGNRFFNAAIFGSFHKLEFKQIGVRAFFSL